MVGDENVCRLAFAESLKMEAAYVVGSYQQLPLVQAGVPLSKVKLDELYEESLKNRELWGPLWQFWGEFRRRQNENYWLNQIEQTMAFADASYGARDGFSPLYLINDCRHHNESAWCKANGFYRVRITGPCRTEDGTDPRDPNHPSERHVDELEVDAEYYNRGDTLDFMRKWVIEDLLPRALKDAE